MVISGWLQALRDHTFPRLWRRPAQRRSQGLVPADWDPGWNPPVDDQLVGFVKFIHLSDVNSWSDTFILLYFILSYTSINTLLTRVTGIIWTKHEQSNWRATTRRRWYKVLGTATMMMASYRLRFFMGYSVTLETGLRFLRMLTFLLVRTSSGVSTAIDDWTTHALSEPFFRSSRISGKLEIVQALYTATIKQPMSFLFTDACGLCLRW